MAGCPVCHSNLDSRQTELSAETGKKYEIPVFYFTELMGLACGDPEAKKWLNRHLVDPKPLLAKKGLI